MEEITVSAPGKVILHGEHAVVYKKAAIAASLSLRTRLQIKQQNNAQIKIDFPNINFIKTWEIDAIQPLLQNTKVSFSLHNAELPSTGDLQAIRHAIGSTNETSDQDLAVLTFFSLYLIMASQYGTYPAIEVRVTSNLPIGSGLGSSASFCVCCAAGLLFLYGHVSISAEGSWSREDLNLINKWAYLGEKIIHGTPSGVDNSVATFGGALRFQGGEVTLIENMPSLRILLVDTKVPRSTKQLVAKVREKRAKYPSVFDPVLESMDAVARACQDIYTNLSHDGCEADTLYDSLEEMIDINQNQLRILGVSHPALEEVCRICATYKLHAKLTGAGGGGCAFCILRPGYCNEEIKKFKSELESMGFMCWETEIGGSGVMFHGSMSDEKKKTEIDELS